jgi:pimeloyl-ACP methyl ester carboxylesterase
MTAVFVHGVPETAAVWEPLVSQLDRADVALLSLPGFGCDITFEPTMHNYADWLRLVLGGVDEVDLVAHDWGGLLALRVLADEPANVRSWVVDVGDLGPGFRWHDMARTFQTTDEGEALMAGLLAVSVDERAELLVASGIPEVGASSMAATWDQRMADCILALYRSATDIAEEWGPGIDDIVGPGLVVESGLDPFRNPALARRLAARTGAGTVELPDAGHWWMLESPDGAAAMLTEFWSSLP